MAKYLITRTEVVHQDGSKGFSKTPVVVSDIDKYRSKVMKKEQAIKVNFIYEQQDY
jgi:hypothetical protein